MVCVQGKQISGKLLLQGERLDVELQNLVLISVLFRELYEILNLFDICLQRLGALRPQMSVHPLQLRKLEKLLSQSKFNLLLVAEPLVRNTRLKEFVEIKVVGHQEVDIRSIELHVLLIHDG